MSVSFTIRLILSSTRLESTFGGASIPTAIAFLETFVDVVVVVVVAVVVDHTNNL